jgi:hypothetical protein
LLLTNDYRLQYAKLKKAAKETTSENGTPAPTPTPKPAAARTPKSSKKAAAPIVDSDDDATSAPLTPVTPKSKKKTPAKAKKATAGMYDSFLRSFVC